MKHKHLSIALAMALSALSAFSQSTEKVKAHLANNDYQKASIASSALNLELYRKLPSQQAEQLTAEVRPLV